MKPQNKIKKNLRFLKNLMLQLYWWLHVMLNFKEKKPTFEKLRIIRCIKAYFDGWEDNDETASITKVHTQQLGITKIHISNKKHKMIITITLLRPGLLIGKAGREINNLEKYMVRVFEKPVEIHIIESRLWG